MRLNRVMQVSLLLLSLGLTCKEYVLAENLELENRLRISAKIINEMIEAPDGGIPKDLLRRSKGVIIFPSVIRVGMGVGGQYGKGVALRLDSSERKWGPPAFVTLVGGSFGWQIGVQSTDLTLLVMSEVDLKNLFKNRFTIGLDASISAGPVGRSASAETDIALSVGILSYSRTRGLFAGVTIQGSSLEVDWSANEAYYGSDISIIDIFFHKKGELSPAAVNLVETLNRALAK